MKVFFILFLFKNAFSFSCFCKNTILSNTTSTSVCDCPQYPSFKPSRIPTKKPSFKPTDIATYKPSFKPVENPSKRLPYDVCPDNKTHCTTGQYCPDGSLCGGTLIEYDPILEVVNKCTFPLFIKITGNAIPNNPILPKYTKILENNSQAFDVKGWSGRINTNHSKYPSLAEFNFGRTIWYDISLVDAFDSLPISIKTSTLSCINPSCNLTLSDCPSGHLKDKSCLSPCSLTHSSMDCCGNISPNDCRNGPVVNTSYIKLVNKKCPTVYSYSYDDSRGLHTCSGDTNMILTYC